MPERPTRAGVSRTLIAAVPSIRPDPHLELLTPTIALRLVGVRASGTTDLRPSAWQSLISGLWPHEAIEIIHYFGPEPYELHVRLLQSAAARASESREALILAVSGAFPLWVFDQVEPTPSHSLPVRAKILPASLRLSRTGKDQEESLAAIPFPAALPSWRLTTPFREPLIQGAWSLHVRFTARAAGDIARATLHKALVELERGVLRLHLPDAPTEPYLHNTKLEEATDGHLRALLESPHGFDLVVSVHAEQAPTQYALRRIGRDIFGQYPFNVAGPDTSTKVVWPFVERQGLPGAFPADACLIDAGIPSIAPEAALLPEGPGAVVGTTSGGVPVLLPDALSTSHTFVVGASGSGKTSLLIRLVTEQMKRGAGVAYLDPHGGADFDLVLGSVPADRRDDVVVIDVDDPESLPAMNPMEGTVNSPRLRQFIATQIGELIRTQFETKDSSGPMTSSLIHHSLVLAMHHPSGGCLADVARMYTDDDFREFLLSKCKDERELGHWRNFCRTTGDHGFSNWKPYIASRFEPMVGSFHMLALLNRPSTIDIAELMRRNAIVLFRLAKGTLSETECQILGTLILLQFHAAALKGNAMGSNTGRAFHIVVDEFATFAAGSGSVPAMFRELRKFNVAMCVATQSVDSLKNHQAGDIATAVLTNTATKCFMRLAPKEAIALDEYTAPEFPAQQIARLPNFNAVLSIAAAGLPPLRFRTALAVPPECAADALDLRLRSGKRYATPMAQVREYLARRHGIPPDHL